MVFGPRLGLSSTCLEHHSCIRVEGYHDLVDYSGACCDSELIASWFWYHYLCLPFAAPDHLGEQHLIHLCCGGNEHCHCASCCRQHPHPRHQGDRSAWYPQPFTIRSWGLSRGEDRQLLLNQDELCELSSAWRNLWRQTVNKVAQMCYDHKIQTWIGWGS